MRTDHLVPLALLVATVASCDLGRANPECPAPMREGAATQVIRLNEEYIEAARVSDSAWFDAHLHEDFIVVLGGGRRLDRDSFLAVVGANPSGTPSLTLRNTTVRVFGVTAQADADAPWEHSDGTRGISRYIDTYHWTGCRWQVISAQITYLPDSTVSAILSQ